MRAKPFVLLDLASQAEAVMRFTQEWVTADILAWMRCYGTVIEEPDLQPTPQERQA
jgi:hypothetical protein